MGKKNYSIFLFLENLKVPFNNKAFYKPKIKRKIKITCYTRLIDHGMTFGIKILNIVVYSTQKNYCGILDKKKNMVTSDITSNEREFCIPLISAYERMTSDCVEDVYNVLLCKAA